MRPFRLTALTAVLLLHAAGAADLLQGGNARVVFVGDSITGLSRNAAAGWAHQMDWALTQTHPGCRPDLVALGGSGQGVRSWLNVEQRSRTAPLFLDIRGIDVQASLARPADVLVIMLGMNDVLAPYVVDEPAALADWTAGYRQLVAALKARIAPGQLALASATPCTEDPHSPKNAMIDRLNEQAAALAKELGATVVPTNQAMWDVLRAGRRRRPDFHVTYDFVHPNEAGHLAIAGAMLRALGDGAAADWLAQARLSPLYEHAPALSCQVEPVDAALGGRRQLYRVRCWLTADPGEPPQRPTLTLAGDGWTITPAALAASDGWFTVYGTPERRVNRLQLEARWGDHTLARALTLPAPWLVTAGLPHLFWKQQAFDPAKARGPIEQAIEAGADFTAAADVSGVKPVWRRWYPSIDYTGLDAPGSVDFAGVSHARNFEGGYGARWIHADRERAVGLDLSSQIFAGTLYLRVWLNGRVVYSGLLSGEPQRRKTIEARLQAGNNALVFALDHIAWQFQCNVDISPLGDDKLDDLRYSVTPP